MILADKIVALRKKKGWSQEELAHQLDVSRQAVSKWESAASIPDLDKILRLGQVFEVSTDYLLKEELEEDTEKEKPVLKTEEEKEIISVSLEEATQFLELNWKNARQSAICVAVLILSPVLLILIGGLSEAGRIGFSEDLAAGIGTVSVLLIVGAAVAVLTIESMKMEKYEPWKWEGVHLQYGVEGIIRKRKTEFEKLHRNCIAAGILLLILCAVPLIAAGGLQAPELVLVVCLIILLILVAVGVGILVWASGKQDGFLILLEEGEFAPDKRRDRKTLKPFHKIYWCAVTAFYLGISLYTNGWRQTWIVWPCAGILYKAIAEIVCVISRRSAGKKAD